MKKLLLSLIILLPALSFSQSYGKRNSLVSYYQDLGYSVYNEYNFTLKEGEEKYVDRTFYNRTFYSGTDYVILLVPLENGVYDADLYLDFSDGTSYSKDDEEDSWAGLEFTPSYTRLMRVTAENYSSWSETYNYSFTLIIMGKDDH